MKTTWRRAMIAACGGALFILSAGVAVAQPDSELVGQLSKELGVTADQARGGAGALFSLAKGKMPADQFSQVAKSVPDMDALLKAAPAGGGGDLSQLGTMAAAAGAFKKLGLDAGMVAKFIPALTKFVGGKGGAEVAKLLAAALK